ncbi:hypothetical protein [Kitasatospora sp. NPDC059571]|uniref:hypothetical protein n=1 Tax=Kitasatospora sp. NPDC059571 TaxID=3346871 RepID=UPI003696A34C
MTTQTLIALWKDPAARAGSGIAHPAGEIDVAGGAGLPLARRAMLLAGFGADGLHDDVFAPLDSDQTVTSLSFETL